MGTSVWLPKIDRILPEVSFESSRSPAKSESHSAMLWVCFPHYSIVCDHLCCECTKSNERSVGHMLLFILSLLAPVCLPTTECQVYQCVPNTIVSGRFESTLLTIIPQIPSSLNSRSSRPGVETSYFRWFVLLARSQYLSTHFFAWPSKS